MIIKNPDVVIFDEATSNLDVDTQELVRESVNILFADKICIIITHDSHMAEIANSIVRLSE
jgi:ATP-binding cassette subfamily C protein